MSTTKHTPGPWTIDRYRATEDTHHHAILAVAADDGRDVTVATVYPISDDGQAGGESHTNARLIAAAPETAAERDRLKAANAELLAALKEAQRMLETASRYFPKSIKHADRYSLLNVLANAVEPAIRNAKRTPDAT